MVGEVNDPAYLLEVEEPVDFYLIQAIAVIGTVRIVITANRTCRQSSKEIVDNDFRSHRAGSRQKGGYECNLVFHCLSLLFVRVRLAAASPRIRIGTELAKVRLRYGSYNSSLKAILPRTPFTVAEAGFVKINQRPVAGDLTVRGG